MKKWILVPVIALLTLNAPLHTWAEEPTATVQKLIDSVRSFKPETASSSAQERTENNKALKVGRGNSRNSGSR